MSAFSCCLKAFEWNGTPAGRVEKLAGRDVYIAGSNDKAAVLIIHDLLGWTFLNARLLADHYAREGNVTVYLPDFLGGEVPPFEPIVKGRYEEVDLAGMIQRNAREIREPEIFACAKALREKYERLGAVGFCYGGWAAFRLGAREHQPPLVDCITVGHPSLLSKKDIDEVVVPVQVLAPEHDFVYTAELKTYTFETLQSNGVAFEYRHFPGMEHGCLVRGNESIAGELDAMVLGKNATVGWFRRHLLEA